eukprot:Skav205895  [mRNA]  locus=scaffold123:194984:196297:+ [translate_table: standard]
MLRFILLLILGVASSMRQAEVAVAKRSDLKELLQPCEKTEECEQEKYGRDIICSKPKRRKSAKLRCCIKGMNQFVPSSSSRNKGRKAVGGMGGCDVSEQWSYAASATELQRHRAEARTGSGKTLAYLYPAYVWMGHRPKPHCVRALFLAPTRELATQIHAEANKFASASSYASACAP